ncbi:MAG: hypothetical protein QXZ31_11825 [Thermofilaceae archaeon]
MIGELVRLFLLPLLREERGVLKRGKPRYELDNDGVHFYTMEGVDGDVLLEIPGVGLLLAPERVMDELRGAPPPKARERKGRVYMLASEFTSEGLRKILEEAAGEEAGSRRET